MNTSQVSLSIAFIAGLASFLSPCVLPLVPIYLAQLVGQGVHQAAQEQKALEMRLITFLHAMTFVFGFTLAFVALGASASALGSFLKANLTIVRQVGGIIVVIIGLHVTGIIKIPLLYRQKRFSFTPSQPGYMASFIMGLVFALAWTPCIGTILSSILIVATNADTLQQGVLLLLAYSLGLGIPFLLLGLGLNQLNYLLKWLKPHLGKIEIATGILMILLGIAVYFNLLIYLNAYFTLA